MVNADSRRNWLLVGLLALICLSVGFGMGRLLDDPGTIPGEDATPTDQAGDVENELVDVAARYLLAQNACADGLDACLLVMQEISAPRWMPNAEEQAREGVRFVTDRFGPGTRVETGLVSYRLDNLDEDSADVSFWNVSVFTPQNGTAEAFWGISTLSLEALGNEWLVVAQSGSPGPSPRSSSPTDDAAPDALSGFRPYVTN